MARKTLAVCALGLLVTAGCATAPPPTTAADITAPAAAAGTLEQLTTTTAAVAEPRRLVIRDLDLDLPLASLGVVTVEGRTEHEVPADAGTIGWYRGGPAPGQPGPALILGHVNWAGVPGAFSALDQLQRGALIHVDGNRYEVYDVRRVPKAEFPDALVYGRTPTSELRLITCGGAFDGAHYTDNVIVSARSSTPAPARQVGPP